MRLILRFTTFVVGKWIFKRELNEQEEPHGNKDLLSFVGTGEGTTKDESSLSCPSALEE